MTSATTVRCRAVAAISAARAGGDRLILVSISAPVAMLLVRAAARTRERRRAATVRATGQAGDTECARGPARYRWQGGDRPARRLRAPRRADREHLAGVTGISAQGMTVDEIRAALDRQAPHIPVATVISVLDACELARYGGPELQPSADAWRHALAKDRRRSLMRFLHPATVWPLAALLVAAVAMRIVLLRRSGVATTAVWAMASRYRASPPRRLPATALLAALVLLGCAMLDPVVPLAETTCSRRGSTSSSSGSVGEHAGADDQAAARHQARCDQGRDQRHSSAGGLTIVLGSSFSPTTPTSSVR